MLKARLPYVLPGLAYQRLAVGHPRAPLPRGASECAHLPLIRRLVAHANQAQKRSPLQISPRAIGAATLYTPLYGRGKVNLMG